MLLVSKYTHAMTEFSWENSFLSNEAICFYLNLFFLFHHSHSCWPRLQVYILCDTVSLIHELDVWGVLVLWHLPKKLCLCGRYYNWHRYKELAWMPVQQCQQGDLPGLICAATKHIEMTAASLTWFCSELVGCHSWVSILACKSTLFFFFLNILKGNWISFQ